MIIDTSLKKKKRKKKNSEQQTSKKEPLKKPTKDDVSNFKEWVIRKETDMNYELFEKHFKFQRSSDMLKFVYRTSDKKKYSKLLNIIKSGWSDLKNEIENMSEEEQETEKPGEIIDIIKKIIEFN